MNKFLNISVASEVWGFEKIISLKSGDTVPDVSEKYFAWLWRFNN